MKNEFGIISVSYHELTDWSTNSLRTPHWQSTKIKLLNLDFSSSWTQMKNVGRKLKAVHTLLWHSIPNLLVSLEEHFFKYEEQ